MEGNMNHDFHHLKRRDFVKYSLLMAAAVSVPAIQGCAIPRKNVPSLDYKTFLIKNARLVDVTPARSLKTPGCSWIKEK